MGSSITLESIAFVSNIYPLLSGVNGGSLMNIFGGGFNSSTGSTIILVGVNECRKPHVLVNRIQCFIPAQGNSPRNAPIQISSVRTNESALFYITYDAPSTPMVISATPSSTTRPVLLNITGSNFVLGNTSVMVGSLPCAVITMTSTSIFCTIHANQSAGSHSIVVDVVSIGQSNAHVSYWHPLKINSSSLSEGSFAGGLPAVSYTHLTLPTKRIV